MKDTNLKITLKTESSPVSSRKRILLQLPSYVLMMAGLLLMMHSVFPSIGLTALIVSFVIVGAIMFVLCNFGIRYYAIPIFVTVFAVVGLSMSKAFSSSATVLIDDVMKKLTLLDGKIHLETGGTGNPVYEAVCLIFLLAILSGFSVMAESILPAIPTIAFVTIGTFFGIISSVPGIVLFAAGVLFIPGIVNLKSLALRASIALVCGAVAFSFSDLTMRNASFRGVKRLLHSAVYDSSSNPLTEGDLSDIGAFERSTKPAVEISMTNPKGIYLKSKAYDKYTGCCWEDADKEIKARYENNFYWLHHNNFYGQTQIANAISAVDELKIDEITIKVRNACSAYMYTPYMLASEDVLDPDVIGDTTIKSQGKTVTIKVADYSWDDIGRLKTKVRSLSDDEQYASDEASYYSYVGEVDLKLTAEAEKYFDRALSGVSRNMSTADALKFVKKYLDENLTYDENATAKPKDKDFIEYLFEDSGKGYSIQYATAAVLMLRYLGVPARYVEGYIIPDSSAELMTPGETYMATENNAHAWAEYYLDGVGFIPFEVTPGYDSLISGYDDRSGDNEQTAEETSGSDEPEQPDDREQNEEPDTSDNGNSKESGKLEDAQKKENSEDNFSKSDQGGSINKKKPISKGTKIILIILLILLILLLMLIIVRRILLKLKLAKIDKMDNRDAVIALYGYAHYLCEKCNVSSDDDEEMAKINSEARFSLHDISDENREKMNEYAAMIKNLAKENNTWLMVFKYKYIDCIL